MPLRALSAAATSRPRPLSIIACCNAGIAVEQAAIDRARSGDDLAVAVRAARRRIRASADWARRAAGCAIPPRTLRRPAAPDAPAPGSAPSRRSSARRRHGNARADGRFRRRAARARRRAVCATSSRVGSAAAGQRVDDVVKAQRDPAMRRVILEFRRLRPFRVEDRAGHASPRLRNANPVPGCRRS